MKKIISLLLIPACLIICFAGSPGESFTQEALGEKLFFDSILSSDRSISCASCHKPAFAFSDTSAVSVGVHNRSGLRNTPSVMNLNLGRFFFWDGRASSLEEQSLGPIENPAEMNLPLHKALSRLKKDKQYRNLFLAVYHEAPTRENLSRAIAAFEKTLETSDSPHDNWRVMEDESAVPDAAKRGFEIFNGKGQCSQCHFGSDFTDGDFRNIGLFNGSDLKDSGRMAVTGHITDLGKFKIPGLRNISMTAPYMHNGMFKTLEEVINYYNDPDKIVPNARNRDSLLRKPLGLTEEEKKDLEIFLRSLTDKKFKK